MSEVKATANIVEMASNTVQCVLAMLVLVVHPRALCYTSAAHLPAHPMDSPSSDTVPSEVVVQQQEDHNGSSGEEESNIILLNNINKRIWDASSLAPGWLQITILLHLGMAIL